MLKPILFLTILSFTSCSNGDKEVKDSATDTKTAPKETASENDKIIGNALTFGNGYVDDCNKMNEAVGLIDWVNSNKLATTGFKAELKKTMDEANKKDPEMGLGADPIFDAQDYPDKGFELDTFDSTTNYVTVKGKNWPEFKLTIKMVKENNSWLVDGCGIINIPDDKRAGR